MVVKPLKLGLVSTSIVLSVLAIHGPAHAQSGGREAQIVVDAETNEVLYESNARELRRPASITKVMTLYLLFDALEKGRISRNDRIVFSRNAANQPPTKLFVGAGNSISVETAIQALVLRSANDVATAVAENIGGSESNFAQMMTSKARELGMSSTTFRNASGLPDSNQRTTAEDLARLAIAIRRDFPDQYHWFSSREMTYNGNTITGHNHLMGRMRGMDGLKTGYTRASGFNLAATTERNGRRVVTIVLGGANRFQRDDLVEALTESAYRELGIGAPQFAAMTPSIYQVNFRDARDAADGAALIMDMPARQVTTGGVTTVAMARSGRRLSFERGAPSFQVADMTQASGRWPTNLRTAPARDDNDDGPTDEGEEESGNVRVAAPTPTPVPFRVAVAPSARPIVTTSPRSGVPVVFPSTSTANATASTSRSPVRVPVSVPVPVPVPVIVPTPVPMPTPLRQMAQNEAQSTTSPERPLVVLPPNTTDPRGPVVVFPDVGTPLRGTGDAQAPGRRSATEAAPPQVTPATQAPTQMAQVEAPSAPSAQPSAPSNVDVPAIEAPVQVAEAAPVSQSEAIATSPAPLPTQMAELARADAANMATQTTPETAPAVTQMAQVDTPAQPTSEAAPTDAPVAETQMAQVAAVVAQKSEITAGETQSGELNGNINLAENPEARASAEASAPTTEVASTESPTTAPIQMADLQAEAVAAAQRRQAEATERELARLRAAQAVETARRDAQREAAAVARAAAERQAAERRAAERLVAEARAKAQKEKEEREARALALAEREQARQRAAALQAEERRQAEATRLRNARGTSIVQVGAFKNKGEANAAIAQFARYFPAFAERQITTVSRSDGVWYRARFTGLGTVAAREACQMVLGRGGACAVVGD